MDMCEITILSHLSSELEVKKKILSEISQKKTHTVYFHIYVESKK